MTPTLDLQLGLVGCYLEHGVNLGDIFAQRTELVWPRRGKREKDPLVSEQNNIFL